MIPSIFPVFLFTVVNSLAEEVFFCAPTDNDRFHLHHSDTEGNLAWNWKAARRHGESTSSGKGLRKRGLFFFWDLRLWQICTAASDVYIS